MWSYHYEATIDDEGIAFLREYASWPAWRRWLWRTVGR